MATTPGILAADLELLRQYDTPTICNVIELFEVRPNHTGYMDQRIKACFPKIRPMVGYATTATYRAAAPPTKGSVYRSLAQQLETFADLPGPAITVYQDLDEPSVAATFGDVMCTSFKAFGAAGLITSGGGRDLDQVEALDFPCFVGSINPSHGYCHMPSIGDPVSVGGLMVYQGDLLHGDLNGVTSIPIEIASEVAHITAEFINAEKVVLDYVSQTPNPTVKGYLEAFDQLREITGSIRQRVQQGKVAKIAREVLARFEEQMGAGL
jgi:4-hydroxy-4-methyl-2-oxoglutarate aldolase